MYVVRGREALPLNSLETSVILILCLYLQSNRQIDPIASRYCICLHVLSGSMIEDADLGRSPNGCAALCTYWLTTYWPTFAKNSRHQDAKQTFIQYNSAIFDYVI